MAFHREILGGSSKDRRRPAGPDTARLSDMERGIRSEGMSLADASRAVEGFARYEPGVVSQLPGESIVRIEVNGDLAGAVYCLPDAPAELALGWAYLHGFFTPVDEIDAVTVHEDRVSLMIETPVDVARQRRVAAGWRDTLDDRSDDLDPQPGPFVIHADVLTDIVREAFSVMDQDRAADGFVHAAVASDTSVHCIARDMSTRPAIAKIAGWRLRDGRSVNTPILVVRGIVDRGVIASMAGLGVSLVATTGIPTAEAFREATGLGVTVVGLARSRRPGVLVDAGHILEESDEA